jgi:hypothetical protein
LPIAHPEPLGNPQAGFQDAHFAVLRIYQSKKDLPTAGFRKKLILLALLHAIPYVSKALQTGQGKMGHPSIRGKKGHPSILLPEARIAVIGTGPVFRGLYFENSHGRILEKNSTRWQRGGINAANAELMGWLQALEHGLPLVHGTVVTPYGAALAANGFMTVTPS